MTSTQTTDDVPAGPSGADRPSAGGRSRSSALGRYHVGLDGLRAAAVAAVLLYHSGMDGIPGGFLGVSQFFTLSGFLVTSMLLRAHDRGGVDLRGFWARRVRRLVPASMVTLAGVVVFGATVATREQADSLPGHMAACVAWVANWYSVLTDRSYVDLFAEPSPVAHFWSLSIEEQFYLFTSFGLVALLRRTAATRTLLLTLGGLFVASASWTVWLTRSGASLDRVYLGTDTRLAELVLGSLLAVVVARVLPDLRGRTGVVLGWAGAAAFVASVWMWTSVPITSEVLWARGGIVGFAGMTALVILGILSGRGPLRAVLGLAPIAAFGRISYGVYLYHWPIFLWLTPDRTGLDGWTLFGVRTLLATAAAAASYRFIEMPVRSGAWSGAPRWSRIVAMPAAGLVVVVACTVTVNRDAPDAMATFREDGDGLDVPITPTDGTLDVLAIHDDTAVELLDRIEADADGGEVHLTRHPFGCDAIAADGAGCAEWADEWPVLVEELNPDVVLLFVDDWPAADLARVTGRPAADLASAAEELLGPGLDLLTARGAPVVWAQPGGSFGLAVQRSLRPFDQAMAALASTRDDLRQVLGGHLPDPDVVTHETYVEEGAAALLSDLSLYQRADRDRLPRVLVVGDSQARSLAYGLERWGAEDERAVVWNVATPGCGIADEGTGESLGQEVEVSDKCREAIAAWPAHVRSFEPDVVLVLTGLWDLTPRRLPGADDLAGIEDEGIRAYLRDEYATAIDVLTAGGAHLVWMTTPCLEGEAADSGVSSVVGPDVAQRLNDEVIRPVVEAGAPASSLFDLAEVLCPDGEPRESVEGIDDLRSDGAHFSVEGSRWFAATYGDELLELAGAG